MTVIKFTLCKTLFSLQTCVTDAAVKDRSRHQSALANIDVPVRFKWQIKSGLHGSD
jgi:hypothetical protein